MAEEATSAAAAASNRYSIPRHDDSRLATCRPIQRQARGILRHLCRRGEVAVATGRWQDRPNTRHGLGEHDRLRMSWSGAERTNPRDFVPSVFSSSHIFFYALCLHNTSIFFYTIRARIKVCALSFCSNTSELRIFEFLRACPHEQAESCCCIMNVHMER